MLETPTRNHPTVVLSRVLAVALIMALVSIGYVAEGMYELIWGSVAIIALSSIVLFIFWAKTAIHATDTELISEFNFIVRKMKAVPYSKIASVNVIRTLPNRIFGTATVQVNINSSINAARPEISICLKNDLANQVRNELSARIYGLNYSAEQEQVYESSIVLTNRDAILHGLFGTSSWFFISSLFFTALSVVFIVFESAGDMIGLISTSLLFALSFLIPMIAMIIRYYNFRVYRLGDTIYLQHGAIQLYKTSFKVNKINSVRIKRTFFARLMNKACLEVDVVGINATQDTTPVLCILTSMDNIDKLMRDVVPDFIYENEGRRQPGRAAIPWLMKAFWASLFTALVYAYPVWFLFMGDVSSLNLADWAIDPIRMIVVGSFVFLVLIYFGAAHLGFNNNRLDVGKDMFMFETGIIDRVRTVMQYDRSQIVDVVAWPSARRLGLARCKVSMLSSSGHSVSMSGYYPVEELEVIGEEVLDRIEDGRYDYKKSTF